MASGTRGRGPKGMPHHEHGKILRLGLALDLLLAEFAGSFKRHLLCRLLDLLPFQMLLQGVDLVLLYFLSAFFPSKCSFKALIWSSNSHTSSSVSVLFFLLSLIFFSKAFNCFFLSLSVDVSWALRSILLPAPS